jgi:chromate reductase
MSINLVGISGSLRRDSYNTRLLKAAQKLMPEGATLELHSIAGIPLYNADDEDSQGLPQTVVALKQAVIAADGLLIATPEYNNSIPGVLKNTIDWLSRPPADIAEVFGGRPTAIIGATPGNFGTILSQNAWLSVMRTLGANLWTGGRLMAPRAATLFDDAGELSDEALTKRLQSFVLGFVAYTQSL